MNGTAAATLAAVVGITYDEIHNLGHALPCPARYVYVLALFGGIGVLFGAYPQLASAIAWALVIAMYIGKDSPFVRGVTRRPVTAHHGEGGTPTPTPTHGGKRK